MALIEVKADIAGTVWKILKGAGDSVATDEPVLILESMKMEIPLVSPAAGVVKEVLVKEGDLVTEGTVAALVSV